MTANIILFPTQTGKPSAEPVIMQWTLDDILTAFMKTLVPYRDADVRAVGEFLDKKLVVTFTITDRNAR